MYNGKVNYQVDTPHLEKAMDRKDAHHW